MAELDLTAEIKELRSTFGSIKEVVDLSKLNADIASLKEAAGAPGLWDNPEKLRQLPVNFRTDRRCSPKFSRLKPVSTTSKF